MPAYLIASVDVKDSDKFKDYLAASPKILEKYTGRFLARGGEVLKLEGNWNPNRIVIVEFDTYEKAKEFWNSTDYKPLKEIRQLSANTNMIIVDGISK